MKRFLSLLISVLLAFSCMIGVMASAPETSAESVGQTEPEAVQTEEPDVTEEPVEGDEVPEETDGEPEDTEDSENGAEEPSKAEIAVEKEFTLTYDANIGPDIDIEGEYILPASRTVKATEAVTVDKPVYSGTLLAEDGDLLYEMKFVSWNTDPDGRGTEYKRGSELFLKSDMTLYAVWEYELVCAEIVVSVVIEAPDGVMPPEDDAFLFTVDSDSGDTVDYIIYGPGGRKTKNGSKKLPAEFELTASDVLILTAVPGTYTVEQSRTENYDILGSHTERVKVSGGDEKEVEFENLYIEPLGTVTVHVIGSITEPAVFVLRGVDGDNDNIEMTFIIPEGEDGVTITDLPMGSYEVEYREDWSYRLEAENTVRTAVLKRNGDEVNVAFEFSTSPLVNWLTAVSYFIESFIN